MTPEDIPSSHLSWLIAKLGAHKNRAADLLSKICGFLAISAPGGMKASVLQKFVGMMDEVAEEHHHEIQVLNRIDELEALHHRNRKAKKVKCAEDAPSAECKQELIIEPPVDRSQNSLLSFLFFWRFFLEDENEEQKQDLTPS